MEEAWEQRREQGVLGCHENQGSGIIQLTVPPGAWGMTTSHWVWFWDSWGAHGPGPARLLPFLRRAVPLKLRGVVRGQGGGAPPWRPLHACDGAGSPGRI